MASILAVRNLVHDRTRFAVTLVGVCFAVLLINIQIGLFLGFATTTSGLIDHSHADLWIMPTGTQDLDQVKPLAESKLYQALAVPGVAAVGRLNLEFAYFKKPTGGTDIVIVVGFDPDSNLGGPWNVVEGDVHDLGYQDTIMVDDLYRERLGITHLGQTVEISGHRARVVGFTHGIRSFTQSPYVFASTKSAARYSRIAPDETKYVLVSLAKGADPDTVKANLTQRIADVDVRSNGEFSRLTQLYWMFTTGAGLALLVAAAMGLAVGAVVVSQTLYATTIEHLAEFATLRAVGGSNRYIHGVIMRQAAVSAVVGYSFGLALTLAIIWAAQNAGPAILLPPWTMAATFVLTLLMCAGAAAISIRKVTSLDPAMVFK